MSRPLTKHGELAKRIERVFRDNPGRRLTITELVSAIYGDEEAADQDNLENRVHHAMFRAKRHGMPIMRHPSTYYLLPHRPGIEPYAEMEILAAIIRTFPSGRPPHRNSFMIDSEDAVAVFKGLTAEEFKVSREERILIADCLRSHGFIGYRFERWADNGQVRVLPTHRLSEIPSAFREAAE